MSREEKNQELNAKIAYYLVKSGYKKPELAVRLGISTASFYNKLKNPDTFTFKELRNLFSIMKLTEQEIVRII